MTKERENGLNPNLLLGIIVVLVIVIAVMGFFLGRLSSNGGGKGLNVDSTIKYEDLSIKVIKDSRDSNPTIPYEAIIETFKSLASTSTAEVTIVDFKDNGVADYMKENNIRTLPAFIFSTNNFDTSGDAKFDQATMQPITPITSFLTPLPSGEYSLMVGATYDPFIERSDRGFRLLTKEQYAKILEQGAYVEGNENAKIAWLEFSDLQCPYCAKLYSDGTPSAVKAKYGDDINIRFNHFPLDFHPNALPAAEVAECLAQQKGANAFYALIEEAFRNNGTLNGGDTAAAKKFMIEKAVELGADEATLTACANANTFSGKINNQLSIGNEIFAITGTPGNVLINTETLEYDILAGAYPASSFESLIDRLLAE